MTLSHLDETGRARMVDVSNKALTVREATAEGKVWLKPATLKRIQDEKIPKGEVFSVARVAGIMAAKRTPELIPMCHPLPLSGIEIGFQPEPGRNPEGLCCITVTSTVKTIGQTGVEMEALTAVCGATLTIYDMCKSIDREMEMGGIMLISKKGGRSGDYKRDGNRGGG